MALFSRAEPERIHLFLYAYWYTQGQILSLHKLSTGILLHIFKNVGEHWLVRNMLRNVRTFWNGIAYCLSHLLPFIFNDHCNKRMKRVLAWFHDWDMSCGHVTVVNYAFLVYSHFAITMVLWNGLWSALRIILWTCALE